MKGFIARKSKRPAAGSPAVGAKGSSANSTHDPQKTQPDNEAPGTKLQAAARRLGFTWTKFEMHNSFGRYEGGKWLKECECGGKLVLCLGRHGKVRVDHWSAKPSCDARNEMQLQLDDIAIHITLFNDAAARSKRSREQTLTQIDSMIWETTAETKAKLPLIKLARFGQMRSERGSLRHNANVRTISGIELDYDRGDISFDDVLAKLNRLGCTGLLYTSPNHTRQKPRWRILFPTSRELNPQMRRVLATRVDRWFGGIFDPASLVLSQAFYFGRALDNPDPDHRVAWCGDTFIDLHPDLEIQDTPKNQTRAFDPAIISMMRADARLGVSTNPDDYFPDDLDPELKTRVALSVIPSDDYEVWYRVGAALYATLGDDGYAVFDEWSRTSSKFEPRECERKWRECAKMRSIGVGTIFRYADQRDRRWRALYRRLLTGEVAA